MRWMFLILLLLNGVLYAWFLQETQQRERAAARLQPDHTGLAPLVKLSEVPPGGLQPRVVSPPSPPPVSRAAPSVSQAQPPQAAPPAAQKAVPVPAEACYEVGLFADRPAATAFVESLAALPVTGAVVQRRRALDPDYWVYVKGPSGAQQVAELRRSLKTDGLDSYQVQEGPLTGEISVGLYRNKESAEALLSALRAKDYRADIHLKTRWEQAYAVSVRTVQPERWKAFWEQVRGEQADELKSEKKSCTRVATDGGAE